MTHINIPVKYRGREIIIYDIDNTLLDVRERYWKAIEDAGGDPLKGLKKIDTRMRKRFWEIFLSRKYLSLDKPCISCIRELNEKYDNGYIILLLTGRPEYLRGDTVEQLKKNGIKYHLLIMRPNNNREPDHIYKVEVIKRIVDMGYRVIEYHEDDYETIKRIKKLYPDIKVIRHDLTKERFFFHIY